jgi:hypothetical protein
MSKIFQFVNCGQIFQRVLGQYWLVTHAFILLTAHSIISLSFICFPLHPYGTAGKTVVYNSLTFVLVETSKTFMVFVKFGIAALLKLIFS